MDALLAAIIGLLVFAGIIALVSLLTRKMMVLGLALAAIIVLTALGIMS